MTLRLTRLQAERRAALRVVGAQLVLTLAVAALAIALGGPSSPCAGVPGATCDDGNATDGDGWNDLVIECTGTRVRTVVNGVVRTDWDGAGVLDNAAHVARKVGRVGHFALQLHSGDELRIRFKDIQVRER